MLAQLVLHADAMPVSRDYFDCRLAAALAENLAAAPPPFGLVQALEAIGAGPIGPQNITPVDLLEGVLAGAAPDRVGPYALLTLSRACLTWGDRLDMIDSWYEAGEAVDALLGSLRTKKQRMAALIESHLPARRDFWATRCAWTAAALKEAAATDSLWVEMALVGRMIAAETPLAEIPLMKQIAVRTLDAYAMR